MQFFHALHLVADRLEIAGIAVRRHAFQDLGKVPYKSEDQTFNRIADHLYAAALAYDRLAKYFYPQYKDFEEMAVDLWNDHKDIYVIKRYPMYDTDTEFELVYMNTYDYEEDCTRDPFPVTLYPTDFSSREETIYVYRMAHTDLREYPISDFYDSYTGLAGYELTYAWTGSEVVELNCDLEDRDYTMTVDLMPGIPFGAAENGCISIDVYINDEFIDTVTLAPGVNEEGFTLQIDDEMFDEGDNVIRFESNLWDASINNPADPRQLGFAIENVTFVS